MFSFSLSGQVSCLTEGLLFTIGSRNGQNHFGGAVDEVAFWDEAISVEASMEPLPVRPKDKLIPFLLINPSLCRINFQFVPLYVE